jgi:heat shock protein HtpX
MNLYEQQALNRRRTWLVMAAFIALLLVVGIGFDTFVMGQGLVFVPIGTVAALAIGGGQAWWSLRFGDRAVLRSSAAQPLDELLARNPTEDMKLRYTQLDNVVQEMAIAAGLPKPAIYVVPDPDPNAFATGPDAAHASIAVTDGLLKMLNRDELQGVIAHEMSHVRNLDIRLMTVVAALVGALGLLADWSGRVMQFGGGGSRSRDKSEKGSGGALTIVFLAPAGIFGGRERRGAHAQSARAGRRARTNRQRRRADGLDQARHRSPVHRRSARPQVE